MRRYSHLKQHERLPKFWRKNESGILKTTYICDISGDFELGTDLYIRYQDASFGIEMTHVSPTLLY